VLNFARQKDLSLADTAETSPMAPLINPDHHVLDVFFALPEQLDRKWAARSNFGPACT
jgi:hypothetical protein